MKPIVARWGFAFIVTGLAGCESSDDQPDPRKDILGVWLGEEEVSNNSNRQQLLLIYDNFSFGTTACRIGEFNRFAIYPGKINKQYGYESEMGYGFTQVMEFSKVDEQLITNTVIYNAEGEINSENLAVYDSVPSIPKSCNLRDFDIELSNYSPAVYSQGEVYDGSIEYRYRILTSEPTTVVLRTGIGYENGMWTNGKITLESEPDTFGNIVEGSVSHSIEAATLSGAIDFILCAEVYVAEEEMPRDWDCRVVNLKS